MQFIYSYRVLFTVIYIYATVVDRRLVLLIRSRDASKSYVVNVQTGSNLEKHSSRPHN